MLAPDHFFDLAGWAHPAVFVESLPVWTALDRLRDHLSSCFREHWPLRGRAGLVDRALAIHQGALRDDVEIRVIGEKGKVAAFSGGARLDGAAIVMAGAYLFDDRIILGADTVVEPGALIKGPTVVGAATQIRQGAYVRGDCLVGDGCVVGHATEMKSSVLLDGAKAGHFAYVGDSILGRDVNLGAGTKLANLRIIPGYVVFRHGRERIDTGRRKLGAILGDRVETGCNSVTAPGTLVGPDSVIYPTVSVPPGSYPPKTHFRTRRDALLIRSPST